MPFSHIQATNGSIASTGNTCTVTLAQAPTPGNIVCVAVTYFNGTNVPTMTVADSSGNNYAVTPNSPSSVQNVAAGLMYTAYLLSAPKNASATITATFSLTVTGGGALMTAEEFQVSGGVAYFDVDAAGNGSGTASVTTPSITPRASGDLLYAYGTPQGAMSTANSPWTISSSGVDPNGGLGEYILSSASGATSVNFTMGSSGAWDTMAMAFFIAPPIYILAR